MKPHTHDESLVENGNATNDTPVIHDDTTNDATIEIERLLRNIEQIVRKRGKRALSTLDVSLTQFHALLALRDGELTIGDLCKRLDLAPSTVSELVDRMEKSDLVERIRDEEDRRTVYLKTRKKGKEVLQNVLEERRAFLGTILKKITDEERSALRTSLYKLYTLMSADSPTSEGLPYHQ